MFVSGLSSIQKCDWIVFFELACTTDFTLSDLTASHTHLQFMQSVSGSLKGKNIKYFSQCRLLQLIVELGSSSLKYFYTNKVYLACFLDASPRW